MPKLRAKKKSGARARSTKRRPRSKLVPALTFVKAPTRIGGQCDAECDLPRYDNQGNVRCIPSPNCTALGCKCNLYRAKKRTATWEFYGEQGIWKEATGGYHYRCWCTS